MRLFWTLTSLLLLLAFHAKATPPVVQGACAHFPPYKIEESNSEEEHSGIDLDVISAAFAQSGITVQFDFFPWKRTLHLAENGQTDFLCGCNYRPEREDNFTYSDTLGNHSQGIFVNEKSELTSLTNLQDLTGLSVGVVRGYAVHEELKSFPNINVVQAKDDQQLIGILLNNRVDAIYSYRDIIRYRLSRDKKADKLRYFEFSSQPYYVCFARQNTNAKALVDLFNKGLRTIRFNGTYDKIWSQYR